MDIIATQVYENCDAASQISYSTQDNKIQVKISSIILIFSFCIFYIYIFIFYLIFFSSFFFIFPNLFYISYFYFVNLKLN